MRRGGVNGLDASETISAAATAIASSEDRGPQASTRKRSWGSWWSFYWCFGLSKNKRIGHVPEANDNPLCCKRSFVAPPSSPASEPPSAIQSPTGLLSLSVCVSASIYSYSPGGPASIFAIGPYAHETQLVSPPVFSSFTTEPSTAPYTPPPGPESLHLTTTPSSPEVPFARLLQTNLQNSEAMQRYPFFLHEFQSYQLQPGSPVSHLISPRSGISGSGTCSPFPDREIHAGHPLFLEFRTGIRECESCQGSGAVTPEPDSGACPSSGKRSQNGDGVDDGRVSFEITEREAEKKPVDMNAVACKEEKTTKIANVDDVQHEKHRTTTLGSAREFNFDNLDGEPSIEWSFFPMMPTA